MPWTKDNYPNSMKNLPTTVRNKAIEIGNALVKEDFLEEGIAIATAISRAKDWAVEQGIKTKILGQSKATDVKEHGKDRYVIPYENKWAIKIEGRQKIENLFQSKAEAVKHARKEAKKVKGSLTIQLKTGKIEKKISYNPKNVGQKQARKK
jgi:uncharacterized protein YdaT